MINSLPLTVISLCEGITLQMQISERYDSKLSLFDNTCQRQTNLKVNYNVPIVLIHMQYLLEFLHQLIDLQS